MHACRAGGRSDVAVAERLNGSSAQSDPRRFFCHWAENVEYPSIKPVAAQTCQPETECVGLVVDLRVGHRKTGFAKFAFDFNGAIKC